MNLTLDAWQMHLILSVFLRTSVVFVVFDSLVGIDVKLEACTIGIIRRKVVKFSYLVWVNFLHEMVRLIYISSPEGDRNVLAFYIIGEVLLRTFLSIDWWVDKLALLGNVVDLLTKYDAAHRQILSLNILAFLSALPSQILKAKFVSLDLFNELFIWEEVHCKPVTALSPLFRICNEAPW